MSVQITDTVVHRYFGTGTVIELRMAGHFARVGFKNIRATLWVASEELKLVSAGTRAPIPEGARSLPSRPRVRDVRTKRDGDTRYTPERRLLEALRLGVVPEAFVGQFTFGRDEARDQAIHNMELQTSRGRGAAFLLEDEYGKGKTHFLHYLRSSALTQGYAVSTASFDPVEVTPFRVKRVYHELIRSLTWMGGGDPQGFRDLILSPETRLEADHPYLGPLLSLRDRGRLTELHWRWIEGDPNLMRRDVHLPALLEDYVASNLYCNLLSTIGALLRRSGARGWILLFDESEALGGVSSANWRRKGANFLRGLILCASDATDEGAEIELKRSEVYGQPLYKSTRTGLIYSRRRRDVLPYRFRGRGEDPTPFLHPIFAFTPVRSDYYDEIAAYIPESHRIELTDLDRPALHDLMTQLLEAYSAAYGFTVEADDVAYLCDTLIGRFGFHIRTLVKAAVELLDVVRLTPEMSIRKMLSDEE